MMRQNHSFVLFTKTLSQVAILQRICLFGDEVLSDIVVGLFVNFLKRELDLTFELKESPASALQQIGSVVGDSMWNIVGNFIAENIDAKGERILNHLSKLDPILKKYAIYLFGVLVQVNGRVHILIPKESDMFYQKVELYLPILYNTVTNENGDLQATAIWTLIMIGRVCYSLLF